MRFGSKTGKKKNNRMKRALILSGGGSRGAFQAGVWKYLKERKWIPDLISGTSIGAVNAAAIVSGVPAEHLIHLWTTHHRAEIYRFQLLKFIAAILFKRSLRPILDTGRMREVIMRNIDLAALRQSPIDIIISAVNMLTGRLHFYTNREIDIDHLMASSAMPIFFPWQYINGEPYWDGGVMANSPLFAALRKGVEDIIVVLLSPVGHVPLQFPRTLPEGLELVFEHFLSGSYQSTLSAISPSTGRDGRSLGAFGAEGGQGSPEVRGPRIRVVSPSRMLGFRSLLNFSTRQARQLVDEGYRNARDQLQFHKDSVT
jgi:NTE family protein